MREIEELKSNQEETDTRVVLYLNYAVKLGYKSAVVRTPDSDITSGKHVTVGSKL